MKTNSFLSKDTRALLNSSSYRIISVSICHYDQDDVNDPYDDNDEASAWEDGWNSYGDD